MADDSRRTGLVIVHTGDGKGKTTAALGLALRAIGHGMRVRMVQFVKAQDTGEHRAAARLAPEFQIDALGTGFVIGEWQPEDIAAAREAWNVAREAIGSGQWDLVVLDEITYVLNAGAVTQDELGAALSERPGHVTVVITGRDAPAALMLEADLVTEMVSVKHPFGRGIRAQRGIEY